MPKRINECVNYFDKLQALMKVLRNECAWDREQSISSLRQHTLEETHEVLEAIDQVIAHGQWEPLKSELGDLLMQVAFYSVLADEQDKFDLGDVFDGLIKKMIRRHPHVFAGAQPSDLVQQWEQIKESEHRDRTSLMDGIPPLPALAYARKIQNRAARVGFDWDNPQDIIAKMEEELNELAQEVTHSQADPHRIEDEFGDVLFTLVNLGRKLGIDSELALMRTNQKFSRRFRTMEQLAGAQSRAISSMTLAELDALYLEAKRALGRKE